MLRTLILSAVLCLSAAGQTIQSGDDLIIGSGVAYSAVAQQSSSLSSISLKVASIGGKPTYLTTSFETSWAALKGGSLSGSLTTKSGLTQVVYSPHKYVHLWVNSAAGVSKFDLSALASFEGAVGLSWDVGAQYTKDKYHIYITPIFREVSIAGIQVKPSYGIQIQTGFRKVAP